MKFTIDLEEAKKIANDVVAWSGSNIIRDNGFVVEGEPIKEKDEVEELAEWLDAFSFSDISKPFVPSQARDWVDLAKVLIEKGFKLNPCQHEAHPQGPPEGYPPKLRCKKCKKLY